MRFDNGLLLAHPQQYFGIQGSCLTWLTSYLMKRTYCVVVAGVSLHFILATCAVPQGSVLGLLLFVLHMAELMDIKTYKTTLKHVC